MKLCHWTSEISRNEQFPHFYCNVQRNCPDFWYSVEDMYYFHSFYLLPYIVSLSSAPITTKVVSSNLVHGQVCSIQYYVKRFASDLRQVWFFSPGTLVSSANKTDRHDIAERLLKLVLNTINQLLQKIFILCLYQQSYVNVFIFRICVLGTANGWFLKIQSRVHIDQIIEALAQNCPKMMRCEIQWDPDTIRFSDKSSKFIDHIR